MEEDRRENVSVDAAHPLAMPWVRLAAPTLTPPGEAHFLTAYDSAVTRRDSLPTTPEDEADAATDITMVVTAVASRSRMYVDHYFLAPNYTR
jgi:hypothetical protein